MFEIYDQLPDAVFMVDANHRIAYASAACEDIFGYVPGELTGVPLLDLVVRREQDRTLREARNVVRNGARVGFENRYLHKVGNEVQVMWSARWLKAQQLRIGIARDVTSLRQPVSTKIEELLGVARLAPHEKKVLQLLLTEATEKQIAEQLCLAVSTTHSYVTHIFRKFGVRSRAGLMALWLKAMKIDGVF
ncbi:PAS domain S-box protein [Stenotrophomonas sp. Iso1]|uniref:LuxR family transcriptional regulator n=1 Tax=Stenotrophomonas sp. Iso1 TaxID=2977283 RepID=UPI0022B7C07F|nr:PAS domain S-box protein [Stenotrophomonas sp. Iso1]